MAGRKPKVNIEQDIYHETKAHKENREKSTPIYQSQEFIAPDYLEAHTIVWLVMQIEI